MRPDSERVAFLILSLFLMLSFTGNMKSKAVLSEDGDTARAVSPSNKAETMNDKS